MPTRTPTPTHSEKGYVHHFSFNELGYYVSAVTAAWASSMLSILLLIFTSNVMGGHFIQATRLSNQPKYIVEGIKFQVSVLRRVLLSKFALRRPAHSYLKHGYLCLTLPCSLFIMDLTVHCDVSNNPGPFLESRQSYNNLGCGSSKNNYLAKPKEDKVIKYSRSQIYSLRKQSRLQNPHNCLGLEDKWSFS